MLVEWPSVLGGGESKTPPIFGICPGKVTVTHTVVSSRNLKTQKTKKQLDPELQPPQNGRRERVCKFIPMCKLHNLFMLIFVHCTWAVVAHECEQVTERRKWMSLNERDSNVCTEGFLRLSFSTNKLLPFCHLIGASLPLQLVESADTFKCHVCMRSVITLWPQRFEIWVPIKIFFSQNLSLKKRKCRL